ncbi:MAG: hypothetical protein J6V98_01075 [Bacteroidales bacterium]|nr:hypothetical protein [Bacteroidales bacterium]
MKKILYISLAVMLAACSPAKKDTPQNDNPLGPMEELAEFPLTEASTLHLYEGEGTAMVAIKYGDEMQDFIGIGNSALVRDSAGAIYLDTVKMAGVDCYIVYVADISSTYGAESWFVVYPCYREMAPEGPWALCQLPFDLTEISDIDGDGEMEIVQMVRDTNHVLQPAGTFRFVDGVLLTLQ